MEDCWRIVVAAERSGLVYQLAEQSRYAGMFQAWKGIVHRGSLGKITYCEGEYVGYKGDHRYYQDWKTGELLTPEEGRQRPGARPTWMLCPSIHYLPHELSPLLMILDDRVARVTGMGTRVPSYNHPEVEKADIQVALMQTEKDTILRMMCGYTIPTPPARDHHHYQIIGTRGHLESGRTSRDMAKMWLADSHMHDMADVDWRYERTDASDEVLASGHPGHGLLRPHGVQGGRVGERAAGVRRLQGHRDRRPGNPRRRLHRPGLHTPRRPRLQAQRDKAPRPNARIKPPLP